MSWAMRRSARPRRSIGGVEVHRVPYGNLRLSPDGSDPGRGAGDSLLHPEIPLPFQRSDSRPRSRRGCHPSSPLSQCRGEQSGLKRTLGGGSSMCPCFTRTIRTGRSSGLRLQYLESDYVVALTEHERDRLLESYGAKGATTAVVPPGVESGEGTPYADREAVVLFVGRRTASKRLDILYEAMRIVWEKFPDVVLQLAGSSPGVGADPAIWIAADSRVKVIDTPHRGREGPSVGQRQGCGQPVSDRVVRDHDVRGVGAGHPSGRR